jgi:glyoxylase-like metal-dependent hydrolase (beta-lactamase superfamily II)
MRRLSAALVLLALCTAPAAHGHGIPREMRTPQQNDFSAIQLRTQKVSGNVYMLEGVGGFAGGNIGVTAGPDGLLIVDDQFAPLVEKIRAAIKPLSPGALRFVLNTHWHGDHTGSNAIFGREATIIAHANVRKRLAAGSQAPGRNVPAAPPEALPVVTFDNAVSIHFNGEEVRVIHYPNGHTDGDSVIFFTGANVIHMGDDFFVGRFPFVDIDSGGSVEGLIRNVADIIAKAPAGVKIIPGHGPLSNIDDLRTYHAMMVETTNLVRERMRQGKTLEQAKAEGLPEKWKEWGTGFINAERWIETIYTSLRRSETRTGAVKTETTAPLIRAPFGTGGGTLGLMSFDFQLRG